MRPLEWIHTTATLDISANTTVVEQTVKHNGGEVGYIRVVVPALNGGATASIAFEDPLDSTQVFVPSTEVGSGTMASASTNYARLTADANGKRTNVLPALPLSATRDTNPFSPGTIGSLMRITASVAQEADRVFTISFALLR